jgi:hypothetical protein
MQLYFRITAIKPHDPPSFDTVKPNKSKQHLYHTYKYPQKKQSNHNELTMFTTFDGHFVPPAGLHTRKTTHAAQAVGHLIVKSVRQDICCFSAVRIIL